MGALSGSNIGVSGPAAGLAAIVLTAIGTLGGYENFLAAVVIGGIIQLILGFAPFSKFPLIELALEELHGLISVLVLGALVLALHHDARGHVGNAHGRISLVDVLTAGSAGPIGVYAKIGWIHFNFNRVIDNR